MPLIAPRHRTLFLTLFAVFALFGTSMTIVGATLPKILADFRWSYLAAGVVMGASMVTYFVATFAAGHLIRVCGAKPTLVLGLVLDAIGLAFFADSADPLLNTLLGGLIGVGQGAVEICVNWLTLRIDEEHNGRPMNLMHGAFAVGAIVGPLAVGLLLQTGFAWTMVYRAIAAVFAALAVLTLLLPLRVTAPASAEAADHSASPQLRDNPAYWLAFCALFVYVGVELGISNWVAEYFVHTFAYSTAAGALLVSLFWCGLLAGRFGVPLLYRGTQEALLVPLSALAAASVVLLSLFGYLSDATWTSDAGRLLVFLAGLGCSIYYPAIITLLGALFPHAQSQAIGFAASGGGIGAFVFPFAMAALAQQWGIRLGFAAYAAFALLMTAVALILLRLARQQRSQAPASAHANVNAS